MGADPRFYERLGPLTAGDLAARVGARCVGDPHAPVSDVAEPGAALAGALVFLTRAPASPVSAPGVVVIAPEAAAGLIDAAAILVHEVPRAAFARAAAFLVTLLFHDGAELIAASAQIDPTARIAPGVMIGPGAVIGAHAQLGSGAVIGPGVVIGAHTRIGARAAIQCAVIGQFCEVSAGAVIGEAGFGLAYDDDAILTVPHLGRVIVEDDVTIGANSTIDRGMLRDTVLGRGCRIDNLCHIAHNVTVGDHTVMAGFAGVSGSVDIGPRALLGGRVGIADHLKVGAGARIAADAAVMNDVPEGEYWAGSPAQPIKSFMREIAWLRRQVSRKPKKSEPGKEGT
ncbi:MAG: UDP-3-O-(3-hydroxymyristoyl)glucosamine N-acyltransferase [Alphaproteobacteria bacterium]|nr:UDP-3-O-(3-hydroxymyristoyl)glucosamine N-acyltransferase [Alphaproteobacteria bacterium]